VTVFVQDADFTLHVGDVRQVLAELPDESVDCVITSPPYWGLRDYNTEGQLGLEPTPDQYVANMVQVFREVRRVLAPYGTCWVNLGDSYSQGGYAGDDAPANARRIAEGSGMDGNFRFSPRVQERQGGAKRQRKASDIGLKPKDLVGIPWRVAFALQADGWYLRADVIWAKPNPMPESVTDRPTKAHEYVFLLAKQPRYWFDQEAVREPHSPDGRAVTRVVGQDGSLQHRDGERWPNAGRNVRSVWEIATQPYPEAHFATYPEELVRRCLLAGCPEWVCATCGAPWERIVERGESDYARLKREQGHGWTDMNAAAFARGVILKEGEGGQTRNANGTVPSLKAAERTDHGFAPSCGCADVPEVCDDDVDAERVRGSLPVLRSHVRRAGVVLDPFLGSGTTALVARRHGRRTIGIELNPTYAQLAARRLQQLSLLAEGTL